MAIEHADFAGVERLALVTGMWIKDCTIVESALIKIRPYQNKKYSSERYKKTMALSKTRVKILSYNIRIEVIGLGLAIPYWHSPECGEVEE